MSTTSSRNFTTLYSGTGSVVPQGAYGNANVVSLLNEGTDGANTVANIVATGTVTAGYFAGDGSQLTNITAANISGNVNFANTAGTAQFVTGNAQANITSVGTLTSLSVSGNTVGGNLITAGAVSAASVSASGNITGGNLLTGGSITATGNVTAANFFGNVFGNIVGNVDAAGANTQIQFNTGNLLDASANLTFDKSTNILKVTGNATYPTSGLEITKSSIVGNVVYGNLLISNEFQGTPGGFIHLQAYEVLVGRTADGLGSNAPIRAVNNEALELTTTGNGAPAMYVGKYVANSATYTGNVDVRSSNVGGYGGTGNINLSGNVYVSRDAQGADATFGKANLIVRDSIFVDQGISAAGNITGNVFIGNGAGLTNINASNIVGAYGNANVSNFLANGFGSNTIVTTGNITAGNVLGNVFTAPGNANVIIRQIDGVNEPNAVYVDANNLIIGNVGNSSKLVAVSNNQLVLAVSGSGGPQMYFGPASTGNVDLRSSGGAAVGGFAANGNINLSGNVFIGNAASQTAPASTGLNLSVAGNITTGNLLTGGVVSATGNITGGNLRTAGAVSATGNINGGNIIVPVNGKYYGDFTTGTVAGRTVFQTTATGTSAATSLTAVPGPNHVVSNTGFSSQINLFANGTDLGNSAFGRMQMFGNRLNFEVLAAGSGPVGNMRFAAGSAQMVFLNTGNAGIGNANPNHSFSTNEGYFQGNISVTGNVITSKFLQAQGYTAAALNAITGSIGQIAAVSDSAGGGNPNGMLAFWDTTNARWSYIHDNTAV